MKKQKMASYKKMRFKDEFSRSRFTFDINGSGESRNVFVQSKIECIRPVAILILRFVAVIYFLFGMLFSITNHEEKHYWIVYMTSLNYLLVLIYFMYGTTVSIYAIFFRRRYYKNVRGPLMHTSIYNSKENVVMGMLTSEDEASPAPSSTVSTLNGSKSDLMDHTYHVDAILYGFDEKCTKLTVPHVLHIHKSCHQTKTYHHAILHENQLPKVIIETVTDPSQNELGLFFKLYWLCSCITFNLTALTVVIYWVMMFKYQEVEVSPIRWYLRVDRHAVVFLFMIIDHMISRIPVRILHFVYPSMIFLLYGLVNALYTVLTKDFIYEMLNFNINTVTSTVYVVGASFVATPLMQLIIYWTVYRLRERLFSSY